MTKLTFQVEAGHFKSRLDDFLFDSFPGLSKMYLRDLIKLGNCEVNGSFENAGYRLRVNDFVEVEADLDRENAMRPEDVPLEIVFEDEHLAIVNKPAGMLVHPTHRDKNGTLLNALTYHFNHKTPPDRSNGGDMQRRLAFVRPGLIHRLDKQTSGLMVVAKTGQAHRVLADHFKRRLVEKKYLALVDGDIAGDEGSIAAPIGRFAEQKFWGVKDDGKHAETRFLVRRRLENTTLLELEPVTGRTNQLRIHCASIGHPIVGDTARGGSPFERLCLHAHRLALQHPVAGTKLEFIRELPDSFPDRS